MSVVLSAYSKRAFKEFVLPAIHNSETSIVFDRKIFNLAENIELRLEILDEKWRFLPSDDYRIESKKEAVFEQPLADQDYFQIKSLHGEELSIIIHIQESSFACYHKFDMTTCERLTIGNAEESIIQYSYLYAGDQYISQQHGTIWKDDQGIFLEDTSKNGIFVNDVRAQAKRKLNFGDHIHIWGLDLVALGDVLAIRDTPNLCIKDSLQRWGKELGRAASDRAEDSKIVYHRAPRNIPVLATERVEIEAPPAKRELGNVPLAMAIGPSMTMAIPMLMGSLMAIMGARSSGGQASTFMYTGIITSLCSAAIGVFWALANIRYSKSRAEKEERHRLEAYGVYLDKCSEEIKQKYEHNRKVLTEFYPSAEECVSEKIVDKNLLWGRNSTHADFLHQRLGIGSMPFQIEIQIPKERFSLIDDSLTDQPKAIKDSYATLQEVPVCIDLLKENLIGVAGGEERAEAYPVVYALAAQIAANNCYTDVKMAFVYQEEQGVSTGAWEFAKWLPHVWSEDKKFRYVASSKADARDVFYEITKVLRFRSEEGTSINKKEIYKPHYILFIEDMALLEGEPIAKYIFDKGDALGLTTILLAERYEELPNTCERIIQNDNDFRGMFHVKSSERIPVTFDLINQQMLEAMARRLTNFEVNEVEVGGEIPNAITFFEMYGISRLEEFKVAERWKKNRSYESMKALVGQKAGGTPCYLDIHEKYHGPHGLVAGTTGSGKSETLQTYMLSLAIDFSPDDIGFFIIDYKGGGMANLFNGLPHILGQISNLSGNQVRRAMVSIKSENKRRQRVFNEYGVNNINSYTALYKNGEAPSPVPHLFIIIDEFAELKREEGDFMKELISVAQVGRSLGVHLILATQKPSGTVDDNIWSNSKFRLCLRVQDRQDSIDMLHKPDAAYLTQAGRSYLQVGNDELYELFQSGFSGAVYDEESGSSNKVIAKMVADTGRAALVGSHVKRKQKEKRKLTWLMKVAGCIVEAEGEWTLNQQYEEELLKDQFMLDIVFDLLEEDGIDYPQNDYNAKALTNMITLYQEARESGLENIEEITVQIIKEAESRMLKLPEVKDKTQLDAVVKYLADVAEREGYQKPQQLWLPVLPQQIYLEHLAGYGEQIFDGTSWPQYGERWELKTVIGLCDDPTNQAQMPLTINFTEDGHHAVCGIAMSGKSTLLQSIVFALIRQYSPEYLNLYLLDFSSRMLSAFEGSAHVGGVLYESDIQTMGKFFYMLESMVTERKQLFRGGNYMQYVMTNGVVCPIILIVIDNMAGFREKTENKYDDTLIQLARECASFGIYFLISGAGYNSTEIPIRMGDNIHRTLCLEMTDRFQYADCLNVSQVSVLPEPGVAGRGLAMAGGEPLEYQAALSVPASDDYKRIDEIKELCGQMNAAWEGKWARPVPVIPEKPVWSEFAELAEVKALAADHYSLPLGYNVETGDIYGINLSRTYCYTISGKARSGKTNLLKVLIRSAGLKGGKLFVVETSGQELRKTAEEVNADYIDSYQSYMEFLPGFVKEFQLRNRKKKEYLTIGLEEEEVYAQMSETESYYIFIADLAAFTAMAHGPDGVNDNLCGAMANLFEKGFLHNIFFFAGMNPDQRMDMMGKDVYEKFVLAKTGIHLGGNVAGQRLFDFTGMPYSEQSVSEKAGSGVVPPMDDEPYRKLIIPLAKG